MNQVLRFCNKILVLEANVVEIVARVRERNKV
jgi:hypothetical protein